MLFSNLLTFFSKSTFTINSFRNTISVSNSLDPVQVRHFVGSDLCPNCFQTLLADYTSRQRFNVIFKWLFISLKPRVII